MLTKTMIERPKTNWSEIDWVEVGLAKLAETDEAKHLAETNNIQLWEDLREILGGDWNLDDLRTPEMGAAWMLLHIADELTNGTLPISFGNDNSGRLILTVNLTGEIFLSFDFVGILREEVINFRDGDLEFISELRAILDRLENEVKQQEEEISA